MSAMAATLQRPRAAPARRLRQAVDMTPGTPTETREQRLLLRRLAERDPAAAKDIQEQYGRVLRGLLRQMLDDAGTAEEVFQQVLLEAWQRGPTYDPGRASLATWLITIARSRAIDAMRRRVPEPHDPTVATALLDRAGAVEDHAEEVASQWRLAYLLSTLPRAQAELLRMRFQLNLSQSEISERTGIPLGTVKTRMVSALEALRALLAEEGEA